MNITVLIPAYRRPKDLARGLEALKKQTRPADEVLVVVRDTDTEVWAFLETFNPNPLPLRTLRVSIPGQVPALNTGLDAAQGDIIAVTDDDAAPRANWLSRIETYFLSDDCVGGVGGRDWVYDGTQFVDGACEVVGRVQWFGRTVGNHHLGVGKPREVEILKGANMSYRRIAISNIRFDDCRLRGNGLQVHDEMAFSLAVKRAGWKLIYDPTVAVDHYMGERFYEDQRDEFNETAHVNQVHNETLILLEHLPPVRRIVFLIWAVLVGTRSALGFVQWLRFLPSEGKLAGQKWFASMQGRWQGWQTWLQDVRMLPQSGLVRQLLNKQFL